jgi:hypothetical protein
MRRLVETCPYRQPTCQSDGVAQNDGSARCELLVELTGLEDGAPAQVQRDACEACCENFPPSLADINPVVAALLFSLTEEIVASGGAPGCNLETAEELNAWAEKCLPVLLPEETDCPDLPSLGSLDTTSDVVLEDVLPLPQELAPRELVPRELATRDPLDESFESSVGEWAVGVTTTPRRLATIDRCLDSLRQSGWSDVRLFMDDEVDLAENHAYRRACECTIPNGRKTPAPL